MSRRLASPDFRKSAALEVLFPYKRKGAIRTSIRTAPRKTAYSGLASFRNVQ